MTTLRPPDPRYFRQFITRWCGGSDSGAIVVLDNSDKSPRPVGDDIHVGAGWLKRQCVPREAVETKTEQQATRKDP